MSARLKSLAQRDGITARSVHLGFGERQTPEAEASGTDRIAQDNWKVVLERADGRAVETEYSQGSGWNGAVPLVEDVLEAMCSDVVGVISEPRFEDWAASYGFDPDSRRAEAVFNAVIVEQAKLAFLLGAEMGEYLYDPEANDG